ncbi:MAG: hypothetical protein ACE10D_11715 [Planctomycetota bacterium]
MGRVVTGLAARCLLGVAAGLVLFDDAFAIGEGGKVPARPLVMLVGALLGASLLHMMACLVCYRRPPALGLVIVVAAAARMFALFGGPGPGLEGDHEQLRLDAALVNAGVAPHEFTPSQIANPDPVLEETYSAERQERLKRARVALARTGAPDPSKVQHPHLRSTVTPPVHRLNSFAGLLKPETSRGFGFFALVADSIAIFMLIMALRCLGLPLSWVMVYAWSPVLLREVYGTMHADVWILPALAALAWGLAAGRKTIMVAGLAVAVAVRPVMLLLDLALVRRLGPVGMVLVVVLSAALMAPFVDTDVRPTSYVQGDVYVWRNYEYNSLAEGLMRGALKDVPARAKQSIHLAGVEIQREGESPTVLWAKLGCIVLLLGLILFVVLRDKEALFEKHHREHALDDLFMVMVGLLIVTPVLTPWHVLWLLPVLALRPGPSWLMLPGLVCLSHLTHLTGPQSADLTFMGGKLSFRIFEFGAFALFWVVDRMWRRTLLSEVRSDVVEEGAARSYAPQIEYEPAEEREPVGAAY